MRLSELSPGQKVKLPDDPDPGIVDRLDAVNDIVWVRCKVRGDYYHPNSLIDMDPGDLEAIDV